MRKRISRLGPLGAILAGCAALLLPIASQGQENFATIPGPSFPLKDSVKKKLRDFTSPKDYDAAVQDLLLETLKLLPEGQDQNFKAPNFACIIHVVTWKTKGFGVERESWYVYQPKGWNWKKMTGTRIYGKPRIGFLAIHDKVPGLKESLSDVKEKLKSASKTIDGEGFVEYDRQTLTKVDEKTGKSEEVVYPSLAVERAYSQMSYRVDVSKKIPAPLTNLLSLLNFAAQSAAAERVAEVERLTLWSGKIIDIPYLPSDLVFRLFSSDGLGNTTEMSKQTYDDEGRYHWDVSIAFPVNQLKQTEFVADDGKVQAREVNRQRILGALNLFPVPVDTKNPEFSWIPHGILGLELSSRPLDRILVGAGFRLKRIDFFGGYMWTRVRVTKTSTLDDSGNPVVSNPEPAASTDGKWVVGFNIPIKSALDALKGDKKKADANQKKEPKKDSSTETKNGSGGS